MASDQRKVTVVVQSDVLREARLDMAVCTRQLERSSVRVGVTCGARTIEPEEAPFTLRELRDVGVRVAFDTRELRVSAFQHEPDPRVVEGGPIRHYCELEALGVHEGEVRAVVLAVATAAGARFDLHTVGLLEGAV